MRLLYMVMAAVVLFLFLSFQWAYTEPFLMCDLPETGTVITQTLIEIKNIATNTQVDVVGLAQIKGTNFLLYDVGTLTPGKYQFRARWAEAVGWYSDYSLPFTSGKPKPIGTLRIGTIPSVP